MVASLNLSITSIGFLLYVDRYGTCTHTGFLPESDRAPVVEIFTRTGITAAGGQFDIERCTLKITPCRFHTEVFKTVARQRQVQVSRTKKMFVHRNRKRNLLVQYIETDKPHKEDVCA